MARRGNIAALQQSHQETRARNQSSSGFDPMTMGRFRLKPGTSEEIVILDDIDINGGNVFQILEHEVHGPGRDGWKQKQYANCLDDHGVCPLCEKQRAEGKDSRVKASYSAMVVNVLSLTPNVKEYNGQRQERFYKKMLVIKGNDIPEFISHLQAAQTKNREEGLGRDTLRGVVLTLQRSSEKMSAMTGKPVPGQRPNAAGTGMEAYPYIYFDLMSDADIAEYASEEMVSREGDVIVPAGDNLVPFDLEELFAEEDANELCNRFALPNPNAGSSAHSHTPAGGTQQQGAEQPATGGRRRGSATAQQGTQQAQGQQQAGGRRRGNAAAGTQQQSAGGNTSRRRGATAQPDGQQAAQAYAEPPITDLDDEIPF